MKRIFKIVLLFLIRQRRIRNFLIGNIVSKSSDLPREQIIEALFSYPSSINNGFLHIERSIDILKKREIDTLTILDVGAAGGETCVLYAKNLPNSEIIGFEPLPDTYKLLSDKVSCYPNVRIENIALGDVNATLTMNRMSRVTASSLLVSELGSSFDGQNYFGIEKTEQVVVKRLDDIGIRKPIGLIKIDVQGYELEVLKGAAESLKQTHFILLEMQNHSIYVGAAKYFELDEFLRQNGFELFDLIPSIREKGQIKEFDAIYVNTLM